MTKNFHHWILTFNRPYALNRLVNNLGRQGIRSSVFSNHPIVQLTEENRNYLDEVVVNSLNSSESNSWCARSWNSILIRGFSKHERLVLIQDDTNVSSNYAEWLENRTKTYDFMWGPGGDQWHYLTKQIFQNVGYWDERYLGCYCGDADYLKRVWHNCDQSKISVEERHNWGFFHNHSGIEENILTEMPIKMIDPNYVNQHWQLEGGNTGGMGKNDTLLRAQRHFFEKWGELLDSGMPITKTYNRQFREIDWYPWFTKKEGIRIPADEPEFIEKWIKRASELSKNVLN